MSRSQSGVPNRIALDMVMVGQLLRYWSIVTLGERWSTRIVVVLRAPLIRSGPYRWLRHPNYAAVALEIAAAPLVVRRLGLAAAGSVVNAAVLRRRILVQEACLQGEHASCFAENCANTQQTSDR